MGKKWDLYRELYDASTIGLSIVISIIIGGLIGYFLDKRYHSHYHWLFFLFLCFGICAGFRNMYKAAKRAQRFEDKKELYEDKDNEKKT